MQKLLQAMPTAVASVPVGYDFPGCGAVSSTHLTNERGQDGHAEFLQYLRSS